MLVTITQDGRQSAGGTFPQMSGSQQTVVVDAPEPTPSVPYDNSNRAGYNGILYVCDAGLNVGDLVVAYTSRVENNVLSRTVRKAYGFMPGPILGVVTDKTRITVAEVVHAGIAPVFANLQVGQRYFLGTDGRLVAPPLAPIGPLYVHYVGYAVAPDTLMLQPSYPLLRRAPT